MPRQQSMEGDIEDDASSATSTKERSLVWQCFEKIEGETRSDRQASCNNCSKVFSAKPALTADGSAAVTLGGEFLGFEDGCRGKCLLRGDLDLETACEARLGRVLENFGLTALTGAAAETLCKGNLK
nr:zinc finger BED domain-containing protein RICESLEEPER 2-like [Tanacetum cinerariifolium]